jgi:hypothetical protein
LLCSAMERCPCHSLFLGKRIYRYLKGSSSLGLHYSAKEFSAATGLTLQAFSDASFAPGGGKSQECFIIMWFGMPVFWKTARQSMVAQSTAESELMAELTAFQAARSVFAIIDEIYKGLRIELLVDNAAAVAISSNALAMNWRTRHLRVRAHGILEACQNGELTVTKVAGIHQVADLGTKVLPATTLRSLLYQLGMLRGKADDEFVARLGSLKLQLECPAGGGEQDDSSATALYVGAAACMMMGAAMHKTWLWLARVCPCRKRTMWTSSPAASGRRTMSTPSPAASGESRTIETQTLQQAVRSVESQSQVTYKRKLQTPRFVPLPENAHGSWNS